MTSRRSTTRATVAIMLSALIAMLTLSATAAAQPRSGIIRPDSEPSTPTLQLGSELFAANCSTCHGIAGAGITKARPGAGDVMGMGPPLKGKGAMAADFYLRTGFMPLSNPHRQPTNNRVLFSDKEIKSLVKYVASLGPGPAIPNPKPSQGSISQGLKVFTENCAGCHQEDARGGYVTGAMVPPLQGLTSREIAEAVRIGPYLMPKFPKSQITDSQLNSLIKYVQSQNHPSNRGGWGIGNIGPIPEGLVTWWIAVPLLLISCLLVGRRMRR